MSIKMTMDKMLKVKVILDSLATQRFHVRLSFKIKKLLQSIRPDHEIYLEEFKRILVEYGEKDENGDPARSKEGNFLIKKDCISICDRELAELNLQEIALDINKYLFTVEDLEFFKDISVEELDVLEPLIVDFDNILE